MIDFLKFMTDLNLDPEPLQSLAQICKNRLTERRYEMNELKVFSDDLIPVYVTETGNQVVVGRELHESLGIGRDYSNWIKQMADYGFSEGTDYSPFLANRSDGKAGKPKTDLRKEQITTRSKMSGFKKRETER